MNQIRFRLGLCPDPAGGAYSAPPDRLSGFKGATSKMNERSGREGTERGGQVQDGDSPDLYVGLRDGTAVAAGAAS